MKRFIEGEDRTQVILLPACLDDYVEAENPVRVVEVFVDGLELGELMWLTGRLMPDFKTIANFRKDHGRVIRKVCRLPASHYEG